MGQPRDRGESHDSMNSTATHLLDRMVQASCAGETGESMDSTSTYGLDEIGQHDTVVKRL